jgi:hypothetical protein
MLAEQPAHHLHRPAELVERIGAAWWFWRENLEVRNFCAPLTRTMDSRGKRQALEAMAAISKPLSWKF